MSENNETFKEENLEVEPIFKNYKQKQNYYKEKCKNGGRTIWVSKRIGRDGKVLQPGRTYETTKERVVKKTMKDME